MKRRVIKDVNVLALHAGVRVDRIITEESVIHITKEEDEIEFLFANKTHFSTKEVIEDHTEKVS